MIQIKKENSKKIWCFCAVFFLTLFNYNTLISQTIVSPKISAYLVFAFCIIGLVANKRIIVQENLLFVSAILIGLVLISMLVNLDFGNLNGYLIIVMKILGTLLILHTYEKKLFFASFTQVSTVVAIASLIINYVFPIFSLERFLPVVTNRLGIQFYFGILSFKIKTYGSFGLRNYGLFSEPAVFCFFLFIGVLFAFNKEELLPKDILSIAIMALTMITTFSPAGLFSAVVIYFILLYIVFFNNHKSASKVGVLLVGAICVSMFLFYSGFKDGINVILSKADISNGSGAGRLQSIVNNLLQGLKSPIFGGGLAAIVEQANQLGFNTSTTGASLLGFGLPFMVFVICLQIISIYSVLPPKRVLLFICMLILFFLQINNHGLIQSDWFWIVTLLGVGGVESCESFDSDLQFGDA